MKRAGIIKNNAIDGLLEYFSTYGNHGSILSGDADSDNNLIAIAKECIAEMKLMTIKEIKKMGKEFGRLQHERLEYRLTKKGLPWGDAYIKSVPDEWDAWHHYHKDYYDKNYIMVKLCWKFDDTYNDFRTFRKYGFEIITITTA